MNAGILAKMPFDLAGTTNAGSTKILSRDLHRSRLMPICVGSFLAVVLASPIPLASNHPLVWLFWACILGAVGVVMSFEKVAGQVLKEQRVLFFLGSTFVAFALFQSAPLPELRGGLSVNFPSGSIGLPSLSIAPGSTLLATVRTTTYLIFFWLVLRISKNTQRSRALGAVILFGISIHAIMAILALKTFNDANFFAEKRAFLGMATGTFVNKNSFATFLGMGVVLGLALVFENRSQTGNHADLPMKFLLATATGCILAALILTQSRMGITATVMAGVFVILQNRGVKKQWAIIGLGFGAFFLAATVLGHLEQVIDLRQSATIRLELYKQIIGMILARPLTGFGLDSFALAFEIYHARPTTAGFVWDQAHSTYLALWSECGLVFGSLPILAGLLAFRQLGRRIQKNCQAHTMALAGSSALILCALHSLVDFSLEIQANAFLLIALIGMGLGPAQKSKGFGYGNE